jgi:hypothetical protein
MNITKLELNKNNKPGKDSQAISINESGLCCEKRFIEKFEKILADFRDQEDHQAFDDLSHFLIGLDDHLEEVNRLKASADFLEKMMLRAKELDRYK